MNGNRISFVNLTRNLIIIHLIAWGNLSQASEKAEHSLADVKKRRALSIALESVYNQFNSISARDAKTGEYLGFEIEMAKYIADSIGVQISFVPTKWSRIPEAVRKGTVDIGMQMLFIPKKQDIPATDRYSIPYFRTGIGVARIRDNRPFKIQFLEKKTVGIFDDPFAIRLIKKPGISKIKIYDTELSLYESLSNRTADFIACDRPLLVEFAKANAGTVEVAPGFLPMSQGDYGILIRADDISLADAINRAIISWLEKPEVKVKIEALNSN